MDKLTWNTVPLKRAIEWNRERQKEIRAIQINPADPRSSGTAANHLLLEELRFIELKIELYAVLLEMLSPCQTTN